MFELEGNLIGGGLSQIDKSFVSSCCAAHDELAAMSVHTASAASPYTSSANGEARRARILRLETELNEADEKPRCPKPHHPTSDAVGGDDTLGKFNSSTTSLVQQPDTLDGSKAQMAAAIFAESWAGAKAKIAAGQVQSVELLLREWADVQKQVMTLMPADVPKAEITNAAATFASEVVLSATAQIAAAAAERYEAAAAAAAEHTRMKILEVEKIAATAHAERREAAAAFEGRHVALQASHDAQSVERRNMAQDLIAATAARADALAAATEAAKAASDTQLSLLREVAEQKVQLETEQRRAQKAELESSQLRERVDQLRGELADAAILRARLEERASGLEEAARRGEALNEQIVTQLGEVQAALAQEVGASKEAAAAASSAIAAQQLAAQRQAEVEGSLGRAVAEVEQCERARFAESSAEANKASLEQHQAHARERLLLGERLAAAEARAAALAVRVEEQEAGAVAQVERHSSALAEREEARLQLEQLRGELRGHQNAAELQLLQSGEAMRREVAALTQRLEDQKVNASERQVRLKSAVVRLWRRQLELDARRLLRGWRAVAAQARAAKGLRPLSGAAAAKATEAKHLVAQGYGYLFRAAGPTAARDRQRAAECFLKAAAADPSNVQVSKGLNELGLPPPPKPQPSQEPARQNPPNSAPNQQRASPPPDVEVAAAAWSDAAKASAELHGRAVAVRPRAMGEAQPCAGRLVARFETADGGEPGGGHVARSETSSLSSSPPPDSTAHDAADERAAALLSSAPDMPGAQPEEQDDEDESGSLLGTEEQHNVTVDIIGWQKHSKDHTGVEVKPYVEFTLSVTGDGAGGGSRQQAEEDADDGESGVKSVRPAAYQVHHRFSSFKLLHQQLQAGLRRDGGGTAAADLAASEAAKQLFSFSLMTWFDALDPAFIERRRHWLQLYLDQICREPLALAADPTQIFLGLKRELNIVGAPPLSPLHTEAKPESDMTALLSMLQPADQHQPAPLHSSAVDLRDGGGGGGSSRTPDSGIPSIPSGGNPRPSGDSSGGASGAGRSAQIGKSIEEERLEAAKWLAGGPATPRGGRVAELRQSPVTPHGRDSYQAYYGADDVRSVESGYSGAGRAFSSPAPTSSGSIEVPKSASHYSPAFSDTSAGSNFSSSAVTPRRRQPVGTYKSPGSALATPPTARTLKFFDRNGSYINPEGL
eukprot:SAG11_NODE_178_length_13331_cov_17.694906_3_plen_1180_part_00